MAALAPAASNGLPHKGGDALCSNASPTAAFAASDAAGAATSGSVDAPVAVRTTSRRRRSECKTRYISIARPVKSSGGNGSGDRPSSTGKLGSGKACGGSGNGAAGCQTDVVAALRAVAAPASPGPIHAIDIPLAGGVLAAGRGSTTRLSP